MWVVQGVKLSPRHIVKWGAKEVDLDKLVELKCLWNDTLRKEKDQSAHIRLFNRALYRGWLSRDSKDGKSVGW
jgi:hypothetical protein